LLIESGTSARCAIIVTVLQQFAAVRKILIDAGALP